MVHHEAMPELPEVETIRRQLDAALPDRRITKLRASWSKSLHGRGADLMAATGSRISEVPRRGKVLVLWTDQELALLVHLRMTGQLLIDEGLDREGPMTRAVIGLDRGQLVFNDQRKFGRIILTPSDRVDEDPLLARMGPEPLDPLFDAAVLTRQLSRHRSLSIKAALLDQSTVAGIGNIYADEVLFTAGVHPETPCAGLEGAEIERLTAAIPAVLNASLEAGGSTMRDYRDATGASGTYLAIAQVFGRTDLPCHRCGTGIVKTVVAARGTHLCLTCQPLRGPAALSGDGSPTS